MTILETERLVLRQLAEDDAEFMMALANDPDWLRFIGDRGIRTLDDARGYLLRGPVDMYARLGFGVYLVETKEERAPAGICGLIKRDALEDVDLAFAFLPAFRSRGYAFEAAAATMAYGRATLGLGRIAAIVVPGNASSIRLLEKLGFRFRSMIRLPGEDEDICLYAAE